MKFVRWLGAFGTGASLSEAAKWEIKQLGRQVAVEPLWRGRSMIDHAKIGLVVDHTASQFCRAWLSDAWTSIKDDGTLRPEYKPQHRQGKAFKNMDRFLAEFSRVRSSCHGETIFDNPQYSAVVVKSAATKRGKARARRLADDLNLPLKVLRS